MDALPTLTVPQMAEVDRRMIEQYGIQLIQMMENAGQRLAEQANRMLGRDLAGKRISVLCGAGNNGGGGMVAARHLHNRGAKVKVKLARDTSRLKPIPKKQWQIITAIGLHSTGALELQQSDLVIDALIGYGLKGNPREETAAWISRANEAGPPILALDVPSGLEATTGAAGHPCIRAAVTLTLALPKSGLVAPAARPYVGELFVADIGVPIELYAAMGLVLESPFSQDLILPVRLAGAGER